MSDFEFDDILESSFDEVEEPKTPPSGTWELEVISGKLRKRNGENGGPIGEASFACKLVKALDDVNDAQLTEFGDNGIEVSRVYHQIGIWERRDEWNIKRFLEKVLGVSTEGLSKSEGVAAAKGYHFTAFLKHSLNEKDPDNPYVNTEDVRSIDY